MIAKQDGVELRVTRWYDNKAVHLLSTYASACPTTDVERSDKRKRKYIDIKCPNIVKQYNASMGSVDLLESLIALYRIRIRSKNGITGLFSISSVWL